MKATLRTCFSLSLFASLLLLALPARAQTTTLRFSWWGSDGRHKATLAAIDLYQKKNPNVKIEAEYGGFDGYEQKMKVQMAAGTAPDVVQIDQPWLPDLAGSKNFLLGLDKNPEMELSGFDADFMEDFCTFGGRVVAVPAGTNAQTQLVNLTLAKKLGFSLDKPLDWDTLITEARRINKSAPGTYLFNYDGLSHWGFLSGQLRQLAGQPIVDDSGRITFTKAQAVRSFQWLLDAVDAGVFQPIGEAALFSSKPEQNPKWTGQQVLSTTQWTSGLAKDKSTLPAATEWTVILPPTFAGLKSGTAMIRPASVYAVTARSKSAKEAVRFISWLTNDAEAALILGTVRSVPASSLARAALAKDPNAIDPLQTKAIELAAKSRLKPDTVLSSNSQIQTILGDLCNLVEFKQMSPEKAADELIVRMTRKIEELKAKK